MTGTDIANYFHETWSAKPTHRNCFPPAELEFAGNLILMHLYRDADYLYWWLLEVRWRDDEGELGDFLAVYKAHGGPGINKCEWWGHPLPTFSRDSNHYSGEKGSVWSTNAAMKWFIDWTEVNHD
jgi:hypothetical protein